MPLPFLFLDRDGTLVLEPADEQIDSLEKLTFYPGAISALHALRHHFTFVLASNQDGLGTPSFPEADFWPAHNKMLQTLEGEGIYFADQLIDRSFPADNLPTRKPGIGMFASYPPAKLTGAYVVGDRATDIRLARNLGIKGILLRTPTEAGKLLDEEEKESLALATTSWEEVAEFLRAARRRAEVCRETRETKIRCIVDLDPPPGFDNRISTGLRFFDHMLAQLPHHAGIGLSLDCHGDLVVDEHHTIEDCAIVLGETIRRALGEKVGIERYGFVLPMDESRALCLLDFSGRIHFNWKVPFTREYVGDVPTEMFSHFFHTLCSALCCNLRIEAAGENNHHLAEAVFKAFARALRQAVKRNPFSAELPSSKGLL